MNRIKKWLLVLILTFFIIFGVCCRQARDDVKPDAIIFNHLADVLLDSKETVMIYEINDTKDVFYLYKSLETIDETNQDSLNLDTNWIVNYFYTYNYIADDESFPDSLYDPLYNTIKKSLESIQEKLGLEFKCEKDQVQEEREINVTSELKKIDESLVVSELVLIDLYIPYQIKYMNSSQKYIVMIPVYTFLAFRCENELRFNGQKYDYDSFLNQSNVLKK